MKQLVFAASAANTSCFMIIPPCSTKSRRAHDNRQRASGLTVKVGSMISSERRLCACAELPAFPCSNQHQSSDEAVKRILTPARKSLIDRSQARSVYDAGPDCGSRLGACAQRLSIQRLRRIRLGIRPLSEGGSVSASRKVGCSTTGKTPRRTRPTASATSRPRCSSCKTRRRTSAGPSSPSCGRSSERSDGHYRTIFGSSSPSAERPAIASEQ